MGEYTQRIKAGETLDQGSAIGGVLPNGTILKHDRGTDGSIRDELDERFFKVWWDDVRTPGTTVALGANAPGLENFSNSSTLKIYAFDGAGVLVEEVFLSVQLPHRYREGTDVYPHVHWVPTTAGAGSVVWQLEYAAANPVTGVFPNVSTIEIADAAAGVAWQHQIAPFAAIDGSDFKISTMLHCRLFRDPTHGSDDYAGDAGFLEFDLHFELNSPGSRQSYTK
jgi:hypothetical protein